MKKTLKEEMLEAIVTDWKAGYTMSKAAESCTSIAEKHIKIARLEGFIQGLKDCLDMSVTPCEITKLEQELEKLKTK